jgi:hypothetical protein
MIPFTGLRGSKAILGSFPFNGCEPPSPDKTAWVTCPDNAEAPPAQMTHKYAMIDFNVIY